MKKESYVGRFYGENDPRFNSSRKGGRRIVEVLSEDERYVYVKNVKTGRRTRILKTALDTERQTGYSRAASAEG